MPAKLLILSNDGKVQEVLFDRPRITIGRKAGNDLHFNRPEISGTHAAFLFEEDQFFVSDLGSTNGTMMNGAKLLPNQKYALQDGDTISITPFRIQFVADKDMSDTVTDVDQEIDAPRAGSGTMMDIGGKISTGTEEHKAGEKQPPVSATPASPVAPSKEEAKQAPKPAVEAKAPPPPPKPAPEPQTPPPAPAASARSAEHEADEPVEDSPRIDVPPKTAGDYLWLGLGALFLLLAIGLIAYLLMQ
jgi:pSer/pThr/pTyr-binding forkhead associated (FHA) protein